MGHEQANPLNDRFNVKELRVGSPVWWGSGDNVVVGHIAEIDDKVHYEGGLAGSGAAHRHHRLCLVMSPGTPEDIWPSAGAYMGTHELAYQGQKNYAHFRAWMIRGEWSNCHNANLAYGYYWDAVREFAKAYSRSCGESLDLNDMAQGDVEFLSVPVYPLDMPEDDE